MAADHGTEQGRGPDQGQAPLPLAGCRCLNTRPADEARELTARLKALGAAVLEAPTMACVALPTAAALALLAAWDGESRAIFISRTAVRHGAALLAPHLRARGGQLFAVGPTSAAALAEADLPGAGMGATFDSEGLLALPELTAPAVRGRQIFLFRGAGGRELLAERLAERGARVVPLALYERRPLAPALRQILSDAQSPAAPGAAPSILPGAGDPPDLIVVTSAEGLQALDRCISDQALPALRAVPLVVPSARVAEIARGLGYPALTVAPDPTAAGLAAACVTAWAAHRTGTTSAPIR